MEGDGFGGAQCRVVQAAKNAVSSGRIWVTSARIACTSAGVAADRRSAEQDDLGGRQVMRSKGLASSRKRALTSAP